MPENEVASPIVTPEGLAFALEEVSYSPLGPRKNEPFAVRGKIDLFKLPFFGPIWIIATVTYPERWWEEIIPIVGSPEIRKKTTALGGDFEISFPKGFDREGEFSLAVRAYAGPTMPLDSIVLPPFPPVSTVEGTFTVEGEVPEEEIAFRFSKVTIDGNEVLLANHDADSGLLLEKTTADYLDITPAFEWTGSAKTVTISIKAGYKDWLGGFSPKTEAYTRSISLPESPDAPYSGELETPVRIPLTACGGLTDGAIEVVLKIADEPDYISQIWNVYATKAPEVKKLFDILSVTVNDRSTTNKVTDTDFDFETPTPMTTSEKLAVNFEFQWIGPARTVEVSIRAGHKGIVGWDFVEKTPYYTAMVDLPEASEAEPFTGTLNVSIEIPLTNCGGLTDGAIEIKVEGYISQVWDVYDTKAIEMELLEVKIDPTGAGTVTTDPAPTEGTQHNWHFPHDTIVQVTAHPKAGYVFKSWSGEMTDTTAITAPVYPMTEKRTITAHFREEEAPPKADIKDFDFRATQGTYGIGARVSFTAPYDYKGKAQSGRLTISLGTGVYPSFFTKHTFAPLSVSFKESMNWQSGVINGQFTLPSTLEPGQTYSVRAKLEAISDYTQETDTDWGVLKIAEVPIGYILTLDVSPRGAGTITKSPIKTAYSPGDMVTLTVFPGSGYELDHWGGDASGTSLTTSVIMDSDKLVVAVLREVAPPVGISFSVMLTSIPPWLIPVYEWYIVWRGKTHGQWTDVSYGITLEDVKATGAMMVVLKTATGTRSFTTQTYTLEDGRTYKFNVEYLRLE